MFDPFLTIFQVICLALLSFKFFKKYETNGSFTYNIILFIITSVIVYIYIYMHSLIELYKSNQNNLILDDNLQELNIYGEIIPNSFLFFIKFFIKLIIRFF